MRTFSFIFSFSLFVSIQAFAAPDITGIQGNLSHDSMVTINGSGFGTKISSRPKPIRWDNFEDGTLGKHVETAVGEGIESGIGWWKREGLDSIAEFDNKAIIPAESAVSTRHNLSTKHIRSHHYGWDHPIFPNKGNGLFFKTDVGFADTNKAFVSAWVYIDFTKGPSEWQLKLLGLSRRNELYKQSLRANFITDGTKVIRSVCTMEGSGYFTPYPDMNDTPTEGYWFNIVVEVEENTAAYLYYSKTPHTLGPYYKGSATPAQTINPLDSIALGLSVTHGGQEANTYWDDIYIDNSWARVEIGDSSFYDNCTHREIQIPSAWSDNSVTVSINQGSFTDSDSVYLFVVNEDGTASPGYGPINFLGTLPSIPCSDFKSFDPQIFDSPGFDFQDFDLTSDDASGLPKVEEKSGFAWNIWAEEGKENERLDFSPVSYLRPGKEYQFVVDLSSIIYANKAQSYNISPKLDKKLKKLFLDQEEETIELKVLLVLDPFYFKPLDNIEKTLRINGDKFRRLLQEDNTVIENDPFKKMKEFQKEGKGIPDFVLGRAIYDKIEPLDHEGLAYSALTIWVDNRPIDEIIFKFCISYSEITSSSICKKIDKVQCSDSDPVVLQPTSNPPNAALQFIDLGKKAGVLGIFHNNKQSSKYTIWRLGRDAEDFFGYLINSILSEFEESKDDIKFREYGSWLYKLLFPSNDEGTVARKEFEKFIKPYINEAPTDKKTIPSIFIRMIEQNFGQERIIPFGLMAVDIGNPVKDLIGHHFMIETPLKKQSYQSNSECITNWFMVLPKNNKDILTARKQIKDDILDQWKENAEIFNNISSFGKWMSNSTPEDTSSAIIVLSHHDQNRLYDDKDDKFPSIGVERSFNKPSIAILNGCSTGSPGAIDFVKVLNEKGIETIIATSTGVKSSLAGDFLYYLGKELENNKGSEGIPISQTFFKTLKSLSIKNKPLLSEGYGAEVLRFSLLGNGNLRLCSPKK